MKANLSLWFFPVLLGLSQFSVGQNVTIPDANFKNYLLSVPAINTNSDSEIQVSEAAAFSGTINASNKNISDLTGIEAFTALKVLNCSVNNLTTLDITYNTALITLGCNNNQLTGLDCSTNSALVNLTCGFNNLTGLNIMSNSMLTSLSCESNNLPNLNISGNPALVTLTCANNQLPGLFLDNNTALKYLNCQNNQITYLSLQSHLALREIRCYNNQLTTLNVKNGYNSSFTAFFAYGNPNLSCITVDNPGYSNTNWSGGKDAGAVFSFDCLNVGIAAIDIGDEGYIVYPNPSAGIFTIRSSGTNKQTANLYDVNGKLAFNKSINGNTEVDVKDLNDGVYTLIIRSADSVTTRKVIITR